jgi:hypothetical protein
VKYALMPMPGATASGMLARKHIMKQPMALEMHVAATKDCFTARCRAQPHTTQHKNTQSHRLQLLCQQRHPPGKQKQGIGVEVYSLHGQHALCDTAKADDWAA